MDETLERSLRESGAQLAPLGRRTVAFAIDDTLISLIFVVLLWEPIAAAQSTEEIAALINGVSLYMVMTQILYHTLFVWQYGASLGKMAMKMRVAEAETMQIPRLGVAFNRAIFRVISGMVFYLGFLWAFFDPARQAWHDKTARTLVVNA
ncbi:RDD family protein [Hydrogenimonas sp. SS33]|uniref:RDD family protein n=1 Tax=Hydrogenimonas leucolamina TaxID=2954236 RepID=UPI00336C2001